MKYHTMKANFCNIRCKCLIFHFSNQLCKLAKMKYHIMKTNVHKRSPKESEFFINQKWCLQKSGKIELVLQKDNIHRKSSGWVEKLN